jgi:hypothetical protein
MNASVEKLLTVEATFEVKGRGVVVAPTSPRSQFPGGSMQMLVLLRSPEGVDRRVAASFTISHVSPPKELCFVCLIRDVLKDDVPIGSEIFRFFESDAKA